MNRESDLAPYPLTVAPLTRHHILFHVRQQAARKAAAMLQPWEPDGYLRSVARDATREAQRETVLTLARRALRYARHRAMMSGAYGAGFPADRLAREQWNGLAHGTPIRWWDYTTNSYREGRP